MNEQELEYKSDYLLNDYANRTNKRYFKFEQNKISSRINLNSSLDFKQQLLFKEYLLCEEKSNQEVMKDMLKFIIENYNLTNKK